MKHILLVTIALVGLFHAPSFAQLNQVKITVDQQQVAEWNRFVGDLYNLHKRQLEGKSIRTEERIDGYHQMPEFYREVMYYDASNGRLLSRVAWERENPDRLHEIEVFQHDTEGRVIRDFLARFLPVHRNAPIQTLINFHDYNGDTHSFRQFDASGNRIYEYCNGKLSGDQVSISLEEDQILAAQSRVNDTMDSLEYKVCFGDLPVTAGTYLRPH